MKLVSALSTIFSLSLAAVITGGTAAELQMHFQPQKEQQPNNNSQETTRSLLRGGVDNVSGEWGQFQQDGMCIQKMYDPVGVSDSHKVKFMECDVWVEAQMWQFSRVQPTPNHEYGGLIYNMEGGCLAIVGDVMEHKNVKVVECDQNNPKQHWLSDHSDTTPRDNREFCMAPAYDPIYNRDPVVLLKCEDAYVLNYIFNF